MRFGGAPRLTLYIRASVAADCSRATGNDVHGERELPVRTGVTSRSRLRCGRRRGRDAPAHEGRS